MYDWEYRAFDINHNVCDGQEKANNFSELALKLRQRGLQVIAAIKLNEHSTIAARRLAKMRKRIAIHTETYSEISTQPRTSILSVIRRFFRI